MLMGLNLKTNDATPESYCGGFCPIRSAEFLQDILHVVLHLLLGDKQQSCYLAVLFTDRNLFENLNFAPAQRFVSDMLGQLRGHFRGYLSLACVDLPNRFQDLLSRKTLQEIALCSRVESASDFCVAFEGSQHNHTSAARLRTNRNQSLDPAHVGKPEIHQSDVGLKLLEQMDCFAASGRFPCHLHVRFVPNNGDNADSHQRMG